MSKMYLSTELFTLNGITAGGGYLATKHRVIMLKVTYLGNKYIMTLIAYNYGRE